MTLDVHSPVPVAREDLIELAAVIDAVVLTLDALGGHSGGAATTLGPSRWGALWHLGAEPGGLNKGGARLPPSRGCPGEGDAVVTPRASGSAERRPT